MTGLSQKNKNKTILVEKKANTKKYKASLGIRIQPRLGVESTHNAPINNLSANKAR